MRFRGWIGGRYPEHVTKRLWNDKKGSVSTEYIVIVGTVALGFAVALSAVAPTLMADYQRAQAFVGAPKYPE